MTRRISFVWTTAALLAERPDGSRVKTCTRRDWDGHYAANLHAGDELEAFDRAAHYGGNRIGVIRLTADPVFESTKLAPDEDWFNEGFDWLQERGFKVQGHEPRVLWESWRRFNPLGLWVVRFDVVEVYPSNADPRLMTPKLSKQAPAGARLL